MGMVVLGNKKYEPTVTFDPTITDFSKSPFALKKAKEARAFIEKNGLPGKERSRKKK